MTNPERICVEAGCLNRAGGRWSPYWCPSHDAERVARIGRQLKALAKRMERGRDDWMLMGGLEEELEDDDP